MYSSATTITCAVCVCECVHSSYADLSKFVKLWNKQTRILMKTGKQRQRRQAEPGAEAEAGKGNETKPKRHKKPLTRNSSPQNSHSAHGKTTKYKRQNYSRGSSMCSQTKIPQARADSQDKAGPGLTLFPSVSLWEADGRQQMGKIWAEGLPNA